MADITQKLPPELFIKILCYLSIPDVLRVKQVINETITLVDKFAERCPHFQVKRVFHDTILASPLIQLKIDLFATGLERNAKAGIGLSESRKALLQYSSSLASLRPIEEKVVDGVQTYEGYSLKTAGGVHAVLTDSVRLFTLGSASRGIPSKEWEIPCPINDPVYWCIYPCANLIAFVKGPPHRCVHYSQSRKLNPMQQQLHTNRDSSAGLVRWWTPSHSAIPNNSILEGRSLPILP